MDTIKMAGRFQGARRRDPSQWRVSMAPVFRVRAWRVPNEDQAEPAIRGERAIRLDHRMMLMADLTKKDHFHVRIAPGEWLIGALHWPHLKDDSRAFYAHREAQ